MHIPSIYVLLHADAGGSALKGALVTFGAFMALGGIPMLPYLFSGKYAQVSGNDAVFWSSVAVFAVALFLLGAYKGRITGKKWWITGSTMLLSGGITTAIAYLIGWSLSLIKLE